MQDDPQTAILAPAERQHLRFTDAAAAVTLLEELYLEATEFLARHFAETLTKGHPGRRIRAFYPEIRLTVVSFDKVDSRLSFGHVAAPGTYATTVTRPDLFRNYLIQQITLLVENHGVPVEIGPSDTPIPVHFAMGSGTGMTVPQDGVMTFSLRDVFDVPDLATTNDDIVNGLLTRYPDGSAPLAPLPPSASTTAWHGCRTIPRPTRHISRTMSSSPTTSSTSTRLRSMPARRLPIRRAAMWPLSPPAIR